MAAEIKMRRFPPLKFGTSIRSPNPFLSPKENAERLRIIDELDDVQRRANATRASGNQLLIHGRQVFPPEYKARLLAEAEASFKRNKQGDHSPPPSFMSRIRDFFIIKVEDPVASNTDPNRARYTKELDQLVRRDVFNANQGKI